LVRGSYRECSSVSGRPFDGPGLISGRSYNVDATPTCILDVVFNARHGSTIEFGDHCTT
jgi:hypothetical protein